MKQTSLLVGKVLLNPEVRLEVLNSIKEIDSENNAVSFAYLMNADNIQKENEIPVFKAKGSRTAFKTAFSEAIATELESDSERYSNLKEMTGLEKSASTSSINAFLASSDIQIFVPSTNTKQVISKSSNSEFYTSFEVLDGANTNDGLMYKTDGTTEIVYDMDVDFTFENEVYVISYIDPCDIVGNNCGFETLEPAIVASDGGVLIPDNALTLQEMINSGFDSSNFNSGFPVSGGTPVGLPSGGNSTVIGPIVQDPTLITANVSSDFYTNRYLVSAKIPAFKIHTNRWLGFGATHQKMTFHRAAGDKLGASISSNGTLNVSTTANGFEMWSHRMRAGDVRDRKWFNLNKILVTDWAQQQFSQSFAIFTHHHIAFDGDVILKAKMGFKLENGVIKPSVESTSESSTKVTVEDAVYRASAEYSRRELMARVFGPAFTGETFTVNGIAYNVKGINAFYFTTQFYAQDLQTTP